MTLYTWNNAVGSYTDPAQWAGGVVPLWDDGSTVLITGGVATLQDIEPNNMTIEIGDPSYPRLVLDNAALGPGLDVRVVSTVPVSPYGGSGAVVLVQGYDTNYGTIETTHDQSSPGYYALDFAIEPYSQFNNEGTISADGVISSTTGSSVAFLNFGNGDNLTPSVLNNDGHINILDNTVASITTATVGTGVITLARTTTLEANGYPSLSLGTVAASQSVALEAGRLVLFQQLLDPQSFQGVISDWNPAGQVYLPGQVATSLQFTQTTAGQGDLIINSGNGGFPYAFDLKVAGQHTTDQFSFQLQPGPHNSISGTSVSISA